MGKEMLWVVGILGAMVAAAGSPQKSKKSNPSSDSKTKVDRDLMQKIEEYLGQDIIPAAFGQKQPVYGTLMTGYNYILFSISFNEFSGDKKDYAKWVDKFIKIHGEEDRERIKTAAQIQAIRDNKKDITAKVRSAVERKFGLDSKVTFYYNKRPYKSDQKLFHLIHINVQLPGRSK